MLRYFYSDSLEAAYMQVNFKVSLTSTALVDADEYETKAGDTWDWSHTVSEDFCDPNMIGDVVDMLAEFRTPAQVHHDSEVIFRPQVGDFIKSYQGVPALVVDMGTEEFGKITLAEAIRTFERHPEVTEIIERGGKRFFWPQAKEIEDQLAERSKRSGIDG